jgi:hypothetical protein
MFTNVSYKSINWLKNKTKEGGPRTRFYQKLKGMRWLLISFPKNMAVCGDVATLPQP